MYTVQYMHNYYHSCVMKLLNGAWARMMGHEQRTIQVKSWNAEQGEVMLEGAKKRSSCEGIEILCFSAIISHSFLPNTHTHTPFGSCGTSNLPFSHFVLESTAGLQKLTDFIALFKKLVFSLHSQKGQTMMASHKTQPTLIPICFLQLELFKVGVKKCSF